MVCTDWSSIGADALVEGTLRDGRRRSSRSSSASGTRRAARGCCARATSSRRPPTPRRSRAASPTTSSRPSSACAASPRTEIAFVSNRSGNTEIYVMNADGSNARAATANRSINTFPSWSPTATRSSIRRIAMRTARCSSSRRAGRGKPGRLLSRLGDRMPQYRGVFAPLGHQARAS